MTAEWRQFERAVAAFLGALDPSAKVSHDKHIADADTGLSRQRDVWIETSFGGHIPLKILVSCKRKKTKLSQQDVDAFVGDFDRQEHTKAFSTPSAASRKRRSRKRRNLGFPAAFSMRIAPQRYPSS